jgi:hypothetical protein
MTFIVFLVVAVNAAEEYKVSLEKRITAEELGTESIEQIYFTEDNQKIILGNSGKTLTYLDESDNIVKQRKLERRARFKLSENGMFIGFLDYTGYDHYEKYEFILEDKNGNILWKKMMDAIQIHISNNGDAVITTGKILTPDFIDSKGLKFYDETGQLVKAWETREASILKIASESDKVYTATEEGIIVYDLQGNELWRFQTGGGRHYISDNEEIIFSMHDNQVELYDIDGKLIKALEFDEECRYLSFSKDSRFIGINTGYELYIFDITLEKTKLVYDIKNDMIAGFNVMAIPKMRFIFDGQIIPILVTGVKKIGPNPNDYEFLRYLRVLDSNGNKIFEKFLFEYNGPIYSKTSPTDNSVNVWYPNGIHKFKVDKY